MTKLIPAKCPSCGANLEFPENMEVGHCMHCGGKVIIDKEVHVHGQTAIACPHCGGVDHFVCKGKKELVQKTTFGQNSVFRVSCEGSGKCTFKILDVKAEVCNDGKCPWCKGSGKAKLLGKCVICRGTGRCPTCQGAGKCVYCNGAGKIKCDACDGTGFKIYKG